MLIPKQTGSEAEGRDRLDMGLGAAVDNMISAVIAANPNTIVVVQSGTPISMPWAGKASAILQAWYGGSEGGNAIADIIFGDENPSGKLPITFPIRNEDNPAYLNFRSERGRVLYGEDIFVGYRFYEATAKPVLFSFGHGLSYSTFTFANLTLKDFESDNKLEISIDIANEGEYDGAEVAQVYVKHHNPSIIRPVKELKGFAKIFVPKMQCRKAAVTIDKRFATSFWDESRNRWMMEKGLYQLQVGSSSDRILLTTEFSVENTCYWGGL
jgi:beta-glucosidase